MKEVDEGQDKLSIGNIAGPDDDAVNSADEEIDNLMATA